MRYQSNLLEMYREKEALDKSGSSGSIGSRGSLARRRQRLKAESAGSKPAGGFSTPSLAKKRGGGSRPGAPEQRGAGGGGGGARSSRSSSSASSSSAAAEFIMPRDHFHGPTFHALLHEYRAENSAAAKRLRDEKLAEGAPAALAAEGGRTTGKTGVEGEDERDGVSDGAAAAADEPAIGDVTTEGVSLVGVEGAAGEVPTGETTGESLSPSSRIPSATPVMPVTPATPAPRVPGAIPVAIPQPPEPTLTKTTATGGAAPPPSTKPQPEPLVPKVALPIDAYRNEILEHVRNNRVTVIHGETGSGKSTRIPVMLVEEALDLIAEEAAAVAEAVQEGLKPGRAPEGAENGGGGEGGGSGEGLRGQQRGSSSGGGGGGGGGGSTSDSNSGKGSGGADKVPRTRGGGVRRPRMFVSQPRRAATRALVQRVRQEAESSGRGWGVGLRLGHGVREGPPKAEVTFATTGYLARLLASNPGVLDSHTHLIIDEVSERGVVVAVVVAQPPPPPPPSSCSVVVGYRVQHRVERFAGLFLPLPSERGLSCRESIPKCVWCVFDCSLWTVFRVINSQD